MNNTTNIERFCLGAVKVGFLLILLTPLIYSPITISISTFSEVIFFRVILEIIAVFWAVLLLINWRAYLPRLSPILLALLFFVGSLTLSSLIGFNPMRSFFGTLSRQEGLLTYLHLLVFFVMLCGVIKEKKDWLRLFRTFVIVSIPVAISGITQLFSINWFKGIGCFPPDCWRISATLGNSGFYGKYLMLVLFMSLFLFLVEEKKGWKRFAIFFMALNGILLVVNGTRAAWVGTAVGAMAFSLGWFFLVWKGTFSRNLVRIGGMALIAIALFGIILVTQTDGFKDNIIFERARGLISDITNHENPRFALWKVGFQAWKEHPILGTGLESFMSQYDRFNKPDFRLSRIPELENFDRAHNVYVDMLVMGGLLGLLSYFALFIAAFAMLIRSLERIGILGALTLGSLLIASSVYNFFGFDLVVTYIPLFIILGFVAKQDEQPVPKEYIASWNGMKTGLSLALLILSAFGVFTFNVRPFLASFFVVKANDLLISGQVSQALTVFQKAPTWANSYIAYDARRTVAKLLHRAWQPPDRIPGLNNEKRVRIIDSLNTHLLAMEMHLAQYGSDTYEMNSYLLIIEGYIAFYNADKNPQYLVNAKRVLPKAVQMNPNVPILHQWVSMIATLEGRLEDALLAAKKSYDLFPDQGAYMELLGKAYAIAGRNNEEKEKGVNLLRESLQYTQFYTKERFIYGTIEHLGGLYRSVGNVKAVSELYEEAISLYPKDLPPDVRLYQGLEEAYRQLGEEKKAGATVLRRNALFPNQ